MDDASKEQFKWKFWHLAVILNGVILFYALAVLALFLFPEPIRIPGSIISLILAVVLTFIFKKNYYKTKTWLNNHA